MALGLLLGLGTLPTWSVTSKALALLIGRAMAYANEAAGTAPAPLLTRYQRTPRGGEDPLRKLGPQTGSVVLGVGPHCALGCAQAEMRPAVGWSWMGRQTPLTRASRTLPGFIYR